MAHTPLILGLFRQSKQISMSSRLAWSTGTASSRTARAIEIDPVWNKHARIMLA